ncbi:MAG: hypothetical protein AB7I38_12040 [Dehalococcoidia bacterium]
MATVEELTEPYRNFLLNPLRPTDANVCEICLTFTDGYSRCYPCGHSQVVTRAVLPISYSPHGGQLHTVLAGYKRRTDETARRFTLQLAAVLWRFVGLHEACLARSAGAGARFDIVTTVPSGDPARDDAHPLRHIVGSVVAPTRDRHERLLRRSGTEVDPRTVDSGKYNPARDLDGASVLLIDDTWTTGANAQSAAAALELAGAGPIGILVIGRHVRPDYQDNEARLRTLPRLFDWGICALH